MNRLTRTHSCRNREYNACDTIVRHESDSLARSPGSAMRRGIHAWKKQQKRQLESRLESSAKMMRFSRREMGEMRVGG